MKLIHHIQRSLLIVISSITFLGSSFLSAQDCPNGDLALSSQSEIDLFATVFPDCTNLQGTLTIMGEDIIQLDGLDQITQIDGSLIVRQTSIQNFTGLNNLEVIQKGMQIWQNNNIINFAELESLTGVKGISINENAQLTNLSGLEGITSIESIDNFDLETFGLVIVGNPSLGSLQGLNNLTSILVNVFDGLTIEQNDALLDFNGLNNLESFKGDITIYRNENLVNLSGLEQLTLNNNLINLDITENPNLVGIEALSLEGTLRSVFIRDNESLISLDGLSGIDRVINQFRIDRNDIIEDISVLANMDLSGVFLTLRDNPNLALCSHSSICSYLLSADVDAIISDNATGCNSQFEIIANCVPTGVETININDFHFSIDGNQLILNQSEVINECNECIVQITSITGKVVTTQPISNVIRLPNSVGSGLFLFSILYEREVLYSSKFWMD